MTTLVPRNLDPKMQKRQEKLLAKFDDFLPSLLEPGESVLLATQASSPMTAVEQLTTGLMIMTIKRCVLVFTDRRILHLPTTTSFAPRGSIAQTLYGDLDALEFTSFLGRTMKVRYRSGKKERFYSLPAKELKLLKSIVPPLVGKGAPSGRRERHHLCPRCASPLQAAIYTCGRCGLEFKNRSRATWLSILVPGGGYFYTRHPLLGVFDAIVEAYLLALLFIGLAMMVGGATEDEVAAGVGLAVIFVIVLAIEKLVTVYHALHYLSEYIPVDLKVRSLRAPAAV